MHQLITRSDTLIPAVCYACQLWCPLPCHKWVWLKWYLSTLGWRWKASITAMSCCLSRCFQQSNMSQNVVYSQSNMLFTAKLVIFLCSVISQGKVVALDRWGGKWNHLSMTHRLTTNCAKNYCNRTLIVVCCHQWTTNRLIYKKRPLSTLPSNNFISLSIEICYSSAATAT